MVTEKNAGGEHNFLLGAVLETQYCYTFPAEACPSTITFLALIIGGMEGRLFVPSSQVVFRAAVHLELTGNRTGGGVLRAALGSTVETLVTCRTSASLARV